MPAYAVERQHHTQKQAVQTQLMLVCAIVQHLHCCAHPRQRAVLLCVLILNRSAHQLHAAKAKFSSVICRAANTQPISLHTTPTHVHHKRYPQLPTQKIRLRLLHVAAPIRTLTQVSTSDNPHHLHWCCSNKPLLSRRAKGRYMHWRHTHAHNQRWHALHSKVWQTL